ncbi:MAG: RNA polymerase sigma factor [Phycisphaerales bacterium]
MFMSRAEEQRLLVRAARGDREAAAACIRAHQHALYTYVLRLSGRPDIAEDVVQEAFVRVLANIDRFDPKYRFSTWIFTIARRVYLNMKQKRQPAYDSELVGRAGGVGAESIDHADDRMETRSRLDRALQQLTEAQREVVILFHQFDWPIALIARHLDMPEGTVKSHLHRGRDRLRELLADSSPVADSLAEQERCGRP